MSLSCFYPEGRRGRGKEGGGGGKGGGQGRGGGCGEKAGRDMG